MKELLKALGLSEDATEEDALAKFAELTTPPAPKEEEEDKLTELAESNPEVKALMERVTELETGQRFSEVKTLVDGWSIHSATKFALPEAVTTELQDALIKSPASVKEALDKVFSHILDKGLVKKTEMAKKRLSTDEPELEGSASQRFDARVKELQDQNEKMSFAEAVIEASRDEELYTEYRREMVAGAIVEETEEVEN